MLLCPDNQTYGRFLEDLWELFRDAQQVSGDRRLSAKDRSIRVANLEGRLCDICHPYWPCTAAHLPEPQTANETDFRNLFSERMRLMMAEELFEFVLDPQVESTNNIAERQLRSSALDRKSKRTNKTDTGTARQTRIVSVLESLRRSLPHFTIDAVVETVTACLHRSIGTFQPTGPPAVAG